MGYCGFWCGVLWVLVFGVSLDINGFHGFSVGYCGVGVGFGEKPHSNRIVGGLWSVVVIVRAHGECPGDGKSGEGTEVNQEVG